MAEGQVNTLILMRGEHRFIFFFPDEKCYDILRIFGRWASNPNLPDFTWGDAAMLSEKARAMVNQDTPGVKVTDMTDAASPSQAKPENRIAKYL